MPSRSQLTPKQEAFIAAYLRNGRNGAAAYREAYDVTAMSAASIQREANRLVQNPLIAPRIAAAEARVEQRLERVAEKLAVTKERISEELARIAFGDPSLGEEIPPKLRASALMDRARLHGHIVERKDIRQIRSLEDLSDEELDALAQGAGRENR